MILQVDPPRAPIELGRSTSEIMGALSHFTLEGVGRSKKQNVFFVDAIYLWKRTNFLRVTGVNFSCIFILTLMTWRLPISPNRWPSQAPFVFSDPVASGWESEVPVWAIRRSEKIAFQMLHLRLLPWAPRVLPWTPHPWRRGKSQDHKSYQQNQTHVVLMFDIGDRNKSSSSSSPPSPSSSSSSSSSKSQVNHVVSTSVSHRRRLRGFTEIGLEAGAHLPASSHVDRWVV